MESLGKWGAATGIVGVLSQAPARAEETGKVVVSKFKVRVMHLIERSRSGIATLQRCGEGARTRSLDSPSPLDGGLITGQGDAGWGQVRGRGQGRRRESS